MNPEDTFAFFSKQVERASKGFAIATSTENLQLAALNTRQLFKCHLMKGLIRWRLGQDPRMFFEDALNVLVEGASFLHAKDPKFDMPLNLPVENAYMLSFLLGKRLDFDFENTKLDVADRWLDWSLVSKCNGADVFIESWLEKLKSNKRAALASETYINYFSILEKGLGGEEVHSEVGKAEHLYSRRAKDAFYTGGEQTEGGGQDNGLVVDYRFAVVLKKIGYNGETAHRWNWG